MIAFSQLQLYTFGATGFLKEKCKTSMEKAMKSSIFCGVNVHGTDFLKMLYKRTLHKRGLFVCSLGILSMLAVEGARFFQNQRFINGPQMVPPLVEIDYPTIISKSAVCISTLHPSLFTTEIFLLQIKEGQFGCQLIHVYYSKSNLLITV